MGLRKVARLALALALVQLTAPAFAHDNLNRRPSCCSDEVQRRLIRTRPSCCWDTFERAERHWDTFKRAERRLFLIDPHFNRGFE
jgi:hypothetical protein